MLNRIGILKILEEYLIDFKPKDKFNYYYNREQQLIIHKSKIGVFKYQLYKNIKQELESYPNISLNFKIVENKLIIFPIPKHKYIHKNQLRLS